MIETACAGIPAASCCIFISSCILISCTVQRSKNTEEKSHAAVMHVKTYCTLTQMCVCQHAHAYTDKYGHKREDTKGQRVKIIHQHSDVDGKAAASITGQE